jgi:hypothetical protein
MEAPIRRTPILLFLLIFGEKMAFFSKNNVNFCKNWQLYEQKRQFLVKFFGENIFKFITTVPE